MTPLGRMPGLLRPRRCCPQPFRMLASPSLLQRLVSSHSSLTQRLPLAGIPLSHKVAVLGSCGGTAAGCVLFCVHPPAPARLGVGEPSPSWLVLCENVPALRAARLCLYPGAVACVRPCSARVRRITRAGGGGGGWSARCLDFVLYGDDAGVSHSIGNLHAWGALGWRVARHENAVWCSKWRN